MNYRRWAAGKLKLWLSDTLMSLLKACRLQQADSIGTPERRLKTLQLHKKLFMLQLSLK